MTDLEILKAQHEQYADGAIGFVRGYNAKTDDLGRVSDTVVRNLCRMEDVRLKIAAIDPSAVEAAEAQEATVKEALASVGINL